MIFKTKTWIAISAIATLLLAIGTFWIICNDKQRDQLLNRAFISLNVNIDKDNDIVYLHFSNTGKTTAFGTTYKIFVKINGKIEEIGGEDKSSTPIGIIYPNQIIDHKRQFNKGFFNAIMQNKENMFNIEVNYKTYYGKCIKYTQPLSSFEEEGGYRAQSVEEHDC